MIYDVTYLDDIIIFSKCEVYQKAILKFESVDSNWIVTALYTKDVLELKVRRDSHNT